MDYCIVYSLFFGCRYLTVSAPMVKQSYLPCAEQSTFQLSKSTEERTSGKHQHSWTFQSLSYRFMHAGRSPPLYRNILFTCSQYLVLTLTISPPAELSAFLGSDWMILASACTVLVIGIQIFGLQIFATHDLIVFSVDCTSSSACRNHCIWFFVSAPNKSLVNRTPGVL